MKDRVLALSSIDRTVFEVLRYSDTALLMKQVWARIIILSFLELQRRRTNDVRGTLRHQKELGLGFPLVPFKILDDEPPSAIKLFLEFNYDFGQLQEIDAELKNKKFVSYFEQARVLKPLLSSRKLVNLPAPKTIKRALEHLVKLELIQQGQKLDSKSEGAYFVPSAIREALD